MTSDQSTVGAWRRDLQPGAAEAEVRGCTSEELPDTLLISEGLCPGRVCLHLRLTPSFPGKKLRGLRPRTEPSTPSLSP